MYFITQSPSDIPDEVLAQLSNRIQHGLRAYTPAEQKAVRAAAASFRENSSFDAEQALQEVGTGEALVSLLNEDGQPSIVERAKILPPQCLMAQASEESIAAVMEGQAALMEKYGTAVDRESAYEMIAEAREVSAEEARLAAERAQLEKERAEFEAMKAKEEAKAQKEAEKAAERAEREAQKAAEKAEREAERARAAAEKEAQRAAERRAKEEQKQRERAVKTANSIIGQIGREAGRQLVRGLFGSLRR